MNQQHVLEKSSTPSFTVALRVYLRAVNVEARNIFLTFYGRGGQFWLQPSI